MSEIKYAMVVDQRRCIGCHTCAIACKSENNMPNGATMSLNTVITEGSGVTDLPSGTPLTQTCDMDTFNRTLGTARLDFLTRSCQHCEDAPCVKVCPTGASSVKEGGLVDMNTQACIGCMLCMDACPYEMGAMRVYMKDPKFYVVKTGSQDISPSLPGKVKKCTFCSHKKLEEGEKPFCVDHCTAHARFFGNINDTQSDVYKMTHGSRKVKQPFMTKPGYTKPKPSVYFLE